MKPFYWYWFYSWYLLALSLQTGIFFILPCIDAYARVDLRTRTYDIPPQEVSHPALPPKCVPVCLKLQEFFFNLGSNKGQCHGVGRRCSLLSSFQCNSIYRQCRKCTSFDSLAGADYIKEHHGTAPFARDTQRTWEHLAAHEGPTRRSDWFMGYQRRTSWNVR